MTLPPEVSESSCLGSATRPQYIEYLKRIEESLTTADGKTIRVWELTLPEEPSQLSEWARHFRHQYCPDSEIDSLCAGTGLSRAQYLIDLVFPDKSVAPGPSIRAGDFAELLVADYVEYLLGYWVPRGKYAEKAARNESVKGVDILGFKIGSMDRHSAADTLLAFEVKAQATDGTYTQRLQVAIDDSRADYLRRATTLNAIKRRLLKQGDSRALAVQRFQNPADNPYNYVSGAAAVVSSGAYDPAQIQTSTTAAHPNHLSIDLVVIRAAGLMSLIHALYERAANEV